MNWEFYEKHATDPVRNPIGGEFFSTEAVKNITDAVIRESIQNTLDARLTDSSGNKVTARLRVYISEASGALPPAKAARWFESLWPHVTAKGNGLRQHPKLTEPCPFLVIEDFGTTGLTGDPNAHEIDSDVTNNFLNFFRAEGHSDKSGEKGGSWGIGKNVFPRASLINTYFGYTAREDAELLLLGRSIIKFHRVDGKSYKSDGYWGNKSPEDGLMLPVTDASILSDFRCDFNLKRTTEPGLSVVVPWCDTSDDDSNAIGFESVVEAIVRGFFFSVLKGVLEVNVCTADREVSFTSSTLLNVVDDHQHSIPGLRELIPIITIARWMESVPAMDYLVLNPPVRDKAQKWSEEQLEPKVVEALRDGITSEVRLAISVPMSVRSLGAQPVETNFSIYLEKSPNSHKPVFIRDELVIPDVKAASVPGIRSLVVISDGPIATLLRLAETPAHTQWSTGSSNFKNTYTYGSAAISFVSTSVSNLIGLVNKSEQKPDPSLTIDFFSVPSPPEEQGTKRRNNRPEPVPGTGPAPDAPDVTARTKRFQLQSRQGGFSISPGNAEWKAEFLLKVRLAYDVRRGNPLKRYSVADFNVIEMTDYLVLSGAEVLESKENSLNIKVVSPEFNISMSGFDLSRDLYLDVKAEES